MRFFCRGVATKITVRARMVQYTLNRSGDCAIQFVRGSCNADDDRSIRNRRTLKARHKLVRARGQGSDAKLGSHLIRAEYTHEAHPHSDRGV